MLSNGSVGFSDLPAGMCRVPPLHGRKDGPIGYDNRETDACRMTAIPLCLVFPATAILLPHDKRRIDWKKWRRQLTGNLITPPTLVSGSRDHQQERRKKKE